MACDENGWDFLRTAGFVEILVDRAEADSRI
jgi:hypothetical protein